jgi:hypothetical protein
MAKSDRGQTKPGPKSKESKANPNTKNTNKDKRLKENK